MTHRGIAQIIGLTGDAITFVGAILLAVGEAGEEKRAREKAGAIAVLKTYPELQNLPVDIEGVIIRGEEDVEFAVSRRFSRRAKNGAWVIAGGFILLLISRIMEICAP